MSAVRLAAAAQNAPFWLKRFRKEAYEAAFRDYCEEFGPLYDLAVRESEDLQSLAAAIVDELELGWGRRHFWERGAVRADEKRMLVVYLSPMLLEREGACGVLCECLSEAWNARWPGDSYRTADFATIKSGFRSTIMGIEFRGL